MKMKDRIRKVYVCVREREEWKWISKVTLLRTLDYGMREKKEWKCVCVKERDTERTYSVKRREREIRTELVVCAWEREGAGVASMFVERERISKFWEIEWNTSDNYEGEDKQNVREEQKIKLGRKEKKERESESRVTRGQSHKTILA